MASNNEQMISEIRERLNLVNQSVIEPAQFKDADENEAQETSDVSTIEVIIAKNRHGQTGTAELAFMKRYNKFVSKTYGE